MRAREPLGPTVHWPVAGFQTSAELLMPVSWLSTSVPPVATTRPSAITVAETHWRLLDMFGWVVTTGAGPLISMITEPFELPPICRMRPGRNIAALEVQPAFAELYCPAAAKLRVPAVETKYILPFVS